MLLIQSSVFNTLLSCFLYTCLTTSLCLPVIPILLPRKSHDQTRSSERRSEKLRRERGGLEDFVSYVLI
jgi:hypothetical protein